ncbi:MAG: type II toxin-antitoxin system PemK/MazF family toxin [Marmoricola sp.]
MLRGEIRLVDLDRVPGSEANKRRPAVIVSNDRANAIAARLGRGVVTVVPVTSNTYRIFPFQALLPAAATGLRQDCKA